MAKLIGVLFQQEATPFPSTVEETAMTGRFPHLSEWQAESEEDYQRVKDALAVVELSEFGHRSSETLSGGERRRQDLAVLLVQDPTLFFLDEPANHLDLRYQMLLLKHMRQLTLNRGKALFMALHDMNLATRFCDHSLLLFDSGEYSQGASKDIITVESLSKLYGHPVQQVMVDKQTYWFPKNL